MDDEGKVIALLVTTFIGVMLVTLVVGFIINVVICYFLHAWVSEVPVEHRKLDPALVWLLLIPCFALAWNFFVFMRIPESFKSYFDARGITDVGDCGRTLGICYSISVVLAMIPLVSYFAGIAAFILLILCLVKFHDLKSRIR
jgi:hypothetical protein